MEVVAKYASNWNFVTKKCISHICKISSTPYNKCVTKPQDISTYYKQQGAKQTDAVIKPADWDGALSFDKVPGPQMLPIIGNLHRLIYWEMKNINFYSALKSLHDQYGSIVTLRGVPGKADVLSLIDPEDVAKVFRNEGMWPDRTLIPSFDEYRLLIRKERYNKYPGIISINGEEWFNTRNKLNSILLPTKIVMNYVQPIDSITADMIKIIKKLGQKNSDHEMPEDFEMYIQKFALETMAYITFNQRIGCLNDVPDELTIQFIDNVNEMFDTLFTLDYQLIGYFHKMFRIGIWKKFVDQMDFLDESGKLFLERAKLLLKNKNQSNESVGVFESLLKVDESFASTITIDLLFGGVETTGKTIGITLYLISKHPLVQEKMREELRKLLPSTDSPVTTEVLKQALYLKAVIKESMRIMPPVLGNVRIATKDMVVGGYRIPKGVFVMSNNALMSISEKNYKRPLEFIPERWLRSTTGDLSYKNTNPFTTIPFGFGPRSCAGKKFALLDMEIFLAKIVRNFQINWTYPDMEFKSNLTVGCANPLKFQMIPIND